MSKRPPPYVPQHVKRSPWPVAERDGVDAPAGHGAEPGRRPRLAGLGRALVAFVALMIIGSAVVLVLLVLFPAEPATWVQP